MRLNAPTFPVWLIAVIIGVLGIVGHFVFIQHVTTHSFWLVSGGFALLFLGTLFKGL